MTVKRGGAHHALKSMTEQKAPPSPTNGGQNSDLTTPDATSALPRVVRVSTALGQVYEKDAPYPQLDGFASVDARVTRILEVADDNDPTGRIFLVRAEGGVAPGYVWRDRIAGVGVVDKAELIPEGYLADLEAEEDADPEAGIDVRRVVQRFAGGLLSLIYEVGKPAPTLPPPHNGLRGRVDRITRTAEGPYRVKIAAESNDLVPPGTVLTFTVYDSFSGLEILSEKEADAEEEKAVQATLTAIDEAIDDDGDDDQEGDDDDGDDDDEAGP